MSSAASPATADVPGVSRRFAGVASSVVRDLLALTQRPGVISFAGGLPAPELFDVEGARAAFEDVLRPPRPARPCSTRTTEGNPELRAQIAEMYVARGLPTEPGPDRGHHRFAAGPQPARPARWSIPAMSVLVEQPELSRRAAVLQPRRGHARLGADRRRGHRPRRAGRAGPRAPAGRALHGADLPQPDRADARPRQPAGLVAVAERHGFRVLEDDPYQQLRYSGEPMPPMPTMTDHPELVVCTGSLSKILAPGLRVGWVRTTPSIKPAVVVGKQAADLHTSTLDQAAANAYLASGRLGPGARPGLPRVPRAAGTRCSPACPTRCPAGSSWNRPDGGMFVWAHLPEDMDAADALPRALEHEVAYVPGAPFFPNDSGAQHPAAVLHDVRPRADPRGHPTSRRRLRRPTDLTLVRERRARADTDVSISEQRDQHLVRSQRAVHARPGSAPAGTAGSSPPTVVAWRPARARTARRTSDRPDRTSPRRSPRRGSGPRPGRRAGPASGRRPPPAARRRRTAVGTDPPPPRPTTRPSAPASSSTTMLPLARHVDHAVVAGDQQADVVVERVAQPLAAARRSGPADPASPPTPSPGRGRVWSSSRS